MTPKTVVERYRAARESRSPWETHCTDDHALPQRADLFNVHEPGAKRTDKLFDGTAPDAVDQLAASLLGELTRPGRWSVRLVRSAGSRAKRLGGRRGVVQHLQGHFDRSNFAVEMHQCYLDLVVAGTASLLLEEAPHRRPSAGSVKFLVGSGRGGRSERAIGADPPVRDDARSNRDRFKAGVPQIRKRAYSDPETRIPVIEAMFPIAERSPTWP